MFKYTTITNTYKTIITAITIYLKQYFNTYNHNIRNL